MPTYEYACKDCSVSWELEADLGKAPKTPECPMCDQPGFRYMGNQTCNFSFKDDGQYNKTGTRGANDFHTVRRRYEKLHTHGMDKDSANRWYKNEIENSKQYMKSGHMHYKPMNFNMPEWEKRGLAKGVNDKRKAEKIENAKKITGMLYNKAGKDPREHDPANKQF